MRRYQHKPFRIIYKPQLIERYVAEFGLEKLLELIRLDARSNIKMLIKYNIPKHEEAKGL